MEFKNYLKENKKPAFRADSSEFQNDSIIPALTSAYSIANPTIMSMTFDKFLSCGPAGNRTPETLMSKQDSKPFRAHGIFIISKY